MRKSIDKAKLKIPDSMIAYIHGTSQGAVEKARNQPTPILLEYKDTEARITKAVEALRIEHFKNTRKQQRAAASPHR